MAKTAELRFPSIKRVRPPYPTVPSSAIVPVDPTQIVQSIRVTVGTATASSTAQIPAGAVVHQVAITVGTTYSAGSTVTVTRGATTLFAALAAPMTGGSPYVEFPDTTVAASGVVTATVAGAPGAGACTVTVQFSTPLS